jgi:NADH:ubiquinone oxidoreductase subunit 2 (subunit N)
MFNRFYFDVDLTIYNSGNLLISYYYTWFIKCFLIFIVFLITIAHYLQVSFAWFKNVKIELDLGSKYFELNIFLLVILLSSFLLISSNDFIFIYINIEILNICFTLICYLIYERTTIEATLKYFFSSIIFSYFILLGICMIYFGLYTFNFSSIIQIILNFKEMYSAFEIYIYFPRSIPYYLYNSNKEVYPSILNYIDCVMQIKLKWVVFGLFFIIIGLLGKLGLFPGFFWVLDVYGNISILSNIVLSLIPKIIYLVLIFHLAYCFQIISTFSSSYILVILLLLSGIFTIIYAVIFTLNQWRIKRFLAGSSLVNLSFLIFLMSFLFIKIDEMLITTIFFFLTVYILNLFFFFIIYILLIQPSNVKINYYFEDLRDFVQIRTNHKIITFLLALILLSFVGVPPLIGFFTKLSLFYYLIYQNYYWLIIFMIFANIISAFYYIRSIRFVLFSNSKVFGLFSIVYNAPLYVFLFLVFLFLFSFMCFDYFLYLP